MDFPLLIIDSLGVSHENQYLLWKQNSNTYAQKFVRNDDSHIILKSLRLCNKQNIFTFLKINYDTIRVEEMLPFITKYLINGKEAYQPIIANHIQYTAIKIYTNGNEGEKRITRDDLMEKLFDIINLNYPYNQSTKLNALNNLIIDAITPLDLR